MCVYVCVCVCAESVGPCGEIDIDMFVCVCVAAITESQCQLMDAVYTPTGSQRLLYRLHAQVSVGMTALNTHTHTHTHCLTVGLVPCQLHTNKSSTRHAT